MRIVVAGGGSGGHVTPVIAVLEELEKEHANLEVAFWCDKKFEASVRSLMQDTYPDGQVKVVSSGKFRRYNQLPIWQQLLRFRTIVIPNCIDLFKIAAGFFQSIVGLVRYKPDVVFTKGGFVCLPIGIAARMLNIPLVIHDSDALPGLTNRILARWASRIATGAPLKYYSYPENISTYVGTPIKPGLKPLSAARRKEVKRSLGLDPNRPFIMVTGGGLGAKRINDTVATLQDTLLKDYSLVLAAGDAQYDELRAEMGEDTEHFQLHAFISTGMIDYLSCADVVVARAGMTTILELAALARPTILVPNPYLTGGHQLKNAAVYADADAVAIVDEARLEAGDSQALHAAITEVLTDKKQSEAMGKRLHSFARPHAARDVAKIITSCAKTTA